MKRFISILLVLTMLCSFGLAFAQEEAPAEEPAEEVVETTAEEPAEPAAEPAAEVTEEEAPAEEPAAEELPAEESVPDAEEPPVTDGEAVQDEEIIDGPMGSYVSDFGYDADTLAAGYLNQALGDDLFYLEDGPVTDGGSYAGNQLTGQSKNVYDQLKAAIEEIAAGTRTNTEITVTLSGVDTKTWYTPAELGVSGSGTVYDSSAGDYVLSAATEAAIDAKIGLDLSLVLNALDYDCPYDQYWRDNYTYWTCPYSYKGCTADGVSIRMKDTMTIRLTVNAAYSGGDYTVKTSAASTTTAVNNAKAVVSAAASMSDYQKLVYYRNWICDAVSYNTSAADQGSSGYGNRQPWNVIWVFDGKSSTNVVCEGYARAFQYLCDLTTWDSSELYCLYVCGTMDGGAHAWNVVHMPDGKNYMVDVTNCDSGMVGSPDKLFLVGGSGSVTGGYTFCDTKFIYYANSDDNMVRSYSADMVKLADSNYDPSYSPTPAVTGSLTLSRNSVTMTAGSSATVDASVTTDADSYYLSYSYNSDIVDIEEGDWNNGTMPLTLEAAGVGSCTVTVKLVDADTKTVITSETIDVAVKASYSVRYNANGGSGAPAAQTKIQDQDLTLSSTVPTRSGYVFLGWGTGSTATEAVYKAGGTYTANSSVTLYAVWIPIPAKLTAGRTFTAGITTAGEKACYEFTPTSSKTYGIYSFGSADTKVTLCDASGQVLASNDNSGSGSNFRLSYAMKAGQTYRFEVYYADASATGSISFRFGRVYTVTYNANGGSGAPAAQSKYYGTALKLSTAVPTRSGYTFLGWATGSTAAEAAYAAGASYSSDGNVTLYAVWEKAPVTAVTLNAGRSYTAEITEAGGMVYYDFTPTSSKTYVLHAAGSRSAGITLCDASGKVLAAGNDRLAYAMTAGTAYRFTVTCAAAGSIPLTFGGIYTIKYSANGGSGAPASQTKDYGQPLTLSSTKPTRSGYAFLGWATGSTAASAKYAAGGSYTANASVTLYAVWQKITYSGTGWTQDDSGNWYYFKNSSMVTSGWISSGSAWYYVGKDGAMVTGLQPVAGVKYYFNASGVMQTGWIQAGSIWYYADSNGALATGWQQIGRVWYYFGSDCKMYASQWYGKYYLQSSGAMAAGWTQIGSTWYYFDTSGVRQTGWLKSGGSWYYLDPNKNGRMVYSCTMTIDGTSYTFNSSGKWVS